MGRGGVGIRGLDGASALNSPQGACDEIDDVGLRTTAFGRVL